MRIAVLLANTDRSEFARRHPDDGAKVAALLGPLRPGWGFETVPVRDGALPGGTGSHDGYVVTGSVASVNDPDPWIADLLGFLRAAIAEGRPVAGLCFGHQAVAKALGGTVGPNPGGWELGAVDATFGTPAPWMQPGRETLRLHAAHSEQVLSRPAAAEVIGTGPGCPVGAMRIGVHVFTTQYHPELSAGFMAALLPELAGRLDAETLAQARESLAVPAEGPVFGEWLARFFEHPR